MKKTNTKVTRYTQGMVDQIEYFEEQNEICEKALEDACL